MTTDIFIPTYRRPDRIAGICENVREATPERHQLVFLCDEQESIAEAQRCEAIALINDRSSSYAGAVNTGAAWSCNEWLFLGADDITFYPGWLTACYAAAAEKKALVIGTNDKHFGERTGTSTHFLVSVPYIDRPGATFDGKAGLVLHEGYQHYCVDNELMAAAKARKVYAYAPDSIVEHHPGWPAEGIFFDKSKQADEKARRNREVFDLDRKLFAARYARFCKGRAA